MVPMVVRDKNVGLDFSESGDASKWRPSILSPVPQSKINLAPAGVVSSTQAVFPP